MWWYRGGVVYPPPPQTLKPLILPPSNLWNTSFDLPQNKMLGYYCLEWNNDYKFNTSIYKSMTILMKNYTQSIYNKPKLYLEIYFKIRHFMICQYSNLSLNAKIIISLFENLFYFLFLNTLKVKGYVFVCLHRRISPTAELIWFSFTI